MKNNRGFTLIELLTTVVIIGVIASIAIPSMNRVTDNSKKQAFVDDAKFYVDAVKVAIMDGTYEAPVNNNDVTVINLNAIELDNQSYNSPYGVSFVNNKSYVAVTNEGTSTDPEYTYYFAAQDEKRHAIPLTKIEEIDVDDITYEARNTMEVTVQSLAGDIKGAKSTKGIISGLTNAIEDGEKQDWNVITYSK